MIIFMLILLPILNKGMIIYGEEVIEYNNIRYEVIDNNSVAVADQDAGTIQSRINLPETITDSEGTIYRVKEIKENAFINCSELSNINIPRTIEVIGKNAFNKCERLECVNICSNSLLKVIGEYCFFGCRYLRNINIPNTVEELGEGAFYKCFSLEEINIPENISEIKKCTFKECSNLQEVNIKNNIICKIM